MTQKFEYTVLDLIESAARNSKVQPLNLGGVAGAGGGEGGPAGGFIGWLPQTRVAYDTDEFAYSGIESMPSGTLVDNLAHIRYRLGVLESGVTNLIVEDETIFVTHVDEITFHGAVVTDLGGGQALVTISGGGLDTASGDARYLMLDGSNDPITGSIRINVTDTTADGYGLRIYVDDVANQGNGLRVESVYGRGAFIKGQNEKALWLRQFYNNDFVDSQPAIFLQRQQNDATANAFLGAALEVEDSSPAVFSGASTIKHTLDSSVIVQIDPYADINGAVVLFDAQNNITASGRLISAKKQSIETFSVDGLGNVNIPSGMTYNINNVPHTHASLSSPIFQRNLSSDLTLASGECLVTADYINQGAYSITLEGDAELMIL